MLISQLGKNVSELKNLKAQGRNMIALKIISNLLAKLLQIYVLLFRFLSSINGVFETHT